MKRVLTSRVVKNLRPISLGQHIRCLCGKWATAHAPGECAVALARMDWALEAGVKVVPARGWMRAAPGEAIVCQRNKAAGGRLGWAPLYGFQVRSFNTLARAAGLQPLVP